MCPIALDHLIAHPGNANRMTPAMMAKLTAHIRASGDYPALIVREHPSQPGRYQILDGHHRAAALRALGHVEARCDVWQADDDRAAILLLTLNRLRGADDPQRRGALLERLTKSIPIGQLARLLPEHRERIRRLIETNHAPAPLQESPDFAQMPQAVTFFLTAAQRARLTERLDQVCRDRSHALIRLLDLA